MNRNKKAGIIIVLLMSVALLGIIFIPLAINHLENKIKLEIDKVEGLAIEALHISILDRKLSLTNVLYQTKEGSIKVSLREAHFDGFSLYQLLIKKHLEIDSIQLIEPDFLKLGEIEPQKEKNKSTNNQTNKIEKLSIKSIEVFDGMINIKNNDSSLISSIGLVNSQFTGITLNLSPTISLSQIDYKSFNLEIDSMYLLQDSKHYLKTNKVKINNESGLMAEALSFFPNERYRSGSKKIAYRVNWTTASIDSIHLMLNWDLLLEEQKIHATQIRCTNLEYNSLLDKNYPLKQIKEKPLPHQLLKNLTIPFTIDSLFMVDARFEYNEILEGSSEKGKIYFTEFNAKIANITNDSNTLKLNNKMQASVESKLMDQSLLTVYINYDLASTAGHHQISGSLKNFDLSALNEVFIPLTLIRFESGVLNKLDFNYYLNSEFAEGSIDFYYDDLKMIIYNKGGTIKPELVGKLITGLANAIIIRKSNPLRGNYIKGEIAFERQKEKSFLTFWWKSLFSGMKNTIVRQN